MTGQLDPADVDAIARRVVALLSGAAAPAQLVSAAELSRRLGVSRSTVYEKAEELGGIRIGSGPRARLRFDADQVAKTLGLGGSSVDASARPRSAAVRRRRPRRNPSRRDLLPIRGTAPR